MRMGSTAALLLLICMASPYRSGAAEWGPWSANPKSPVFNHGASHQMRKRPHSKNAVTLFLVGSVRFFQKHISPVDGPRCSMTPTCSHYSLLALRKHGPFLGFMMTADRIVHEYEEQRFVPTVWDGNRTRFYDPVENNDFWFNRSRPHTQPDDQTEPAGKTDRHTETLSHRSLETGK